MENPPQRAYQTGTSSLELALRFGVVSCESAQRLLRLQADTLSRTIAESSHQWQESLRRQDLSALTRIYQRNVEIAFEARGEALQILSQTQLKLSGILSELIGVYRKILAENLDHIERIAGSGQTRAVLKAVESSVGEGSGVAAKAAKRLA